MNNINTSTTTEYTFKVGDRVRHGSPGYELAETIEDITDKGDKKLITFESGHTTVMDPDDIKELIDEGDVQYMRSYPDGDAYESMILL